MKKNETIEMVKTSTRLPKALWRDARVRALDEGRDFQEILASALAAYLKTPIKRQGEGR
jgi:hypothetical protein